MCCCSWGHKESDTTEQLNRTDLADSTYQNVNETATEKFTKLIWNLRTSQKFSRLQHTKVGCLYS